jgi:UDP-glucose 4-epimerase
VLALAAYRERGVPVKVARLFNVIGPHQNSAYGLVVPRLVDQAVSGQPLTVYGDGTHTRTFIDIEDAVDAILLLWAQGAVGESYNVGGTEEVRIVDLAERVRSLSGSASPIRFLPFSQVYGPDYEERERRAPDTSRIRALGFAPRHDLDASLRRILAWRRSR